MDKHYCAVRLKRMLDNINSIHKIRTSEEFKDFYEWLKYFYEDEIQELYENLSMQLSVWQSDYKYGGEYQKIIKNYIFDYIQYGRDFIDRGDEQLIIRKIGNDSILRDVEALRTKFVKTLLEDNSLKTAYEKLSEIIDIRFLVIFKFKVEDLFLTWVNIINFFENYPLGLNTLAPANEILLIKKFLNEIIDYLHDFEIIAPNKSYKIGCITKNEPVFVDNENKAKDYLTLRLAEDSKVPLAATLLDFLEFAKFKINATTCGDKKLNVRQSQLEEIQEITDLLYQHINKKNSQIGAGSFTKLCLIVFNLLESELIPNIKLKRSERIRMCFNFLANVLTIAGVNFSYNDTELDSAYLKLDIFYTEHNLQNDLMSLYDKYKFECLVVSAQYREKVMKDDKNPSVSFDPFVLMKKGNNGSGEIILTINGKNLEQFIKRDMKQCPLTNLYKWDA